jgi:D-alanyl-D-alanine carboxypeptidase/D-alanyl-D-alanine-endopeptidase (penicillin-binding protein 4)
VRRALAPIVVVLALLPVASAWGGASETTLRRSLAGQMRAAGARSGALVVDLANGRTLFNLRADTARVPASNEKIFTTSSALIRFGPSGHLTTRVLGDGELEDDGTYRGNLYLRGGGDPTFGTASFNRSAYGSGASVSDLASRVDALGIQRVTGAVYGDETYFDAFRGGPSSGFGFDPYIGGTLSGLAFNRGLTSSRGTAVQRRPGGFAADQLARALRAAGVRLSGRVAERAAPSGARLLASVSSPPMSTLIRLTNQPSDNFLAEMLLKGLGARFGGRGSTQAGAAVVRGTLGDLGVRPQRVVDGSGLSRGDRTTPRAVVHLLDQLDRSATLAPAFRGSLGVACRSGTLGGRMCRTAAAGRCRGKTGTLSNVSALSGYCDLSDRKVAFSIIMNNVNVSGARSIQDRMAAAIARYTPSTPAAEPAPAGTAPA